MWINIPVKNFVSIVPKEYNEIWISFSIQYTTDVSKPLLERDLHIGDGSGNTLSHIYILVVIILIKIIEFVGQFNIIQLLEQYQCLIVG